MLSLREEIKLLLKIKAKSKEPSEWTLTDTNGMSLDGGIDAWGEAFAYLIINNAEVKNKDIIKCFDTESYIIDNIFKYIDEDNSPDITDYNYTNFFISFTLQHVPNSLVSINDGDVTEVQEKTDYTKVKLIKYSDDSKMYTYYTYNNDYYGESEYVDSESY